jgi:hypothetical protein
MRAAPSAMRTLRGWPAGRAHLNMHGHDVFSRVPTGTYDADCAFRRLSTRCPWTHRRARPSAGRWCPPRLGPAIRPSRRDRRGAGPITRWAVHEGGRPIQQRPASGPWDQSHHPQQDRPIPPPAPQGLRCRQAANVQPRGVSTAASSLTCVWPASLPSRGPRNRSRVRRAGTHLDAGCLSRFRRLGVVHPRTCRCLESGRERARNPRR